MARVVTGELASTSIRVSVASSIGNYYDFDVRTTANANVPPTFIVRAIPKSSQTTDTCGTLQIDESNVKTATGCGGSW